jgi:acetyl esterase/lipase
MTTQEKFPISQPRTQDAVSNPATTTERPPVIPPTLTLIYKTVEATTMPGTTVRIPPIPIQADIYLPSSQGVGGTPQNTPREGLPIFLFIHGGGWIHGTREDYGRTWFRRFLDLNYIVVSMDYRFCPETSFEGQCEDVASIEEFLKDDLQGKLEEEGVRISVDGERIVVAGASAGAHLALLTVCPFLMLARFE